MRSLAVLLLLTAVSCSTVNTEIDWDPDADYGRLKSYKWISRRASAPGAPGDPFLKQRVRAAVDERLAERGYRLVKSGSADFVVAWHAATRRELRVETIHHHYGYGTWPSYAWDRHGLRHHTTYRYAYDVGTLILDMINPTTQRLIWRGTASALVGGDRTPEEREERAREMVDALLERFPPD